MPLVIHGVHYLALTNDGHEWSVYRGRFLMAVFYGTTEAVVEELHNWDATVPAETRSDINHEREE